MRWITVVCVVTLLAGGAAAAAPADVAAGIKQVQEGDFEGAIATLEAAAREMSARPDRTRDLVQAYVYLGVAHVALDQPEEARRSFGEAVARDPRLRLSPQSFSPKVIAAFEEARRAARPARKGGGRTGWILGGAAAGAAAAVIVSRSGGETDAPVFANARMATPVIVCPDGADGQQHITFAVTVDARNPNDTPVAIQSVRAVATIISSPSIPGEVGTASDQEAITIPAAVPARTNTTVRVESFLLCGNGVGGPSRFNEWVVRVTLATSAGVFVLESADRLHVDSP